MVMLTVVSLQCVRALSKYLIAHHVYYEVFDCPLCLNKAKKIKTIPKHILYINVSWNMGHTLIYILVTLPVKMTLLAMSWERTQFAFILLALMELPSPVSRSLWLMWPSCMWRHTEFHPGAQHPGQLIKTCPLHSVSMTGAVWVKDRSALCSCHGLCCTSNHAPPSHPPPLAWTGVSKGRE